MCLESPEGLLVASVQVSAGTDGEVSIPAAVPPGVYDLHVVIDGDIALGSWQFMM